jgi:hypothetical protein
MRPAKDVLQERPLGKAINSVKNNGPELLAWDGCQGGVVKLRGLRYEGPIDEIGGSHGADVTPNRS